MAIPIEEFVAFLGWEVDSGELDEFDEQVKEVTGKVGKFVAAVGAATTALTAAIVHTNRETAEMVNLAESVGLTQESLTALAGVLGGIGLEAENVVDLVEELNNKFGEKKGLGEFAAVDESLKILNLEFKELQDLAPEDQLIRILDAAKDLDDQQKAASAVDMLLGGEASKALGYLRNIDGALADIIERRRALNFLTDEGAEDAKEFNEVWLEIKGSLTSIFAQFAAVAGSVLRPMLEGLRDWIVENRELIKTKIREWAERLGTALKFIWWVVKTLIWAFKRLADAVGGTERALALLGAVIATIGMMGFLNSISKLAATIGPLAKKFFTLANALKALKLMSIIGLLVLAGLAVNSLFRYFQGKDSLVGDIGKKIGKYLDDLTQKFADFFGFSKEEFQLWLVDTVDSIAAAGEAFGEFMMGIGEEIGRFETWGEVWQWWADQANAAIKSVMDWLKEIAAPLMGFINEWKRLREWGTVWKWWADQAKEAIQTVLGWIDRLWGPLKRAGTAVLRVFGRGGPDAGDDQGGTFTPPPPPSQTPSPAAAGAMAAADYWNNTDQSRGDTTVSNQYSMSFDIQGGQASAEQIATEVSRKFRAEAENMKRQSGSGVLY